MAHTVLYLDRSIDASHVIPGHPGKCGRLHGHTYRFEVWVSGPLTHADGMLIDYFDLKEQIDTWDHVHLNDVVAFVPTAELLAAEMQRRLLTALHERARESTSKPGGSFADEFGCVVRLWETPGAYAQVGELTHSGASEPQSLSAAVGSSAGEDPAHPLRVV